MGAEEVGNTFRRPNVNIRPEAFSDARVARARGTSNGRESFLGVLGRDLVPSSTQTASRGSSIAEVGHARAPARPIRRSRASRARRDRTIV